ncbi:MAG: acyltransferase [Rhodobacteraceae bacterium]|nr:acyltransferase [Paracoccaceae bacterium]
MFYRSIHYLRGVAAISVAAYHAFPSDMAPVLAGGVDVFFVISGFVMVEATRGGLDPARFLAARALRIFPVYWMACAIVAVLITSGPARDWLLLAEATPLWQWPVAEPFLGPGWTLTYEMLFYFLFAACLGRWWLVSAFLLGLACLGGVWQVVVTNPIIVEFAFGMAIANVPRRILARYWPVLLSMAVAGFCFASLAEYIPMAVRWWMLGIPAVALVAGLVGAEKLLTESRALHFLGSASYSVYLVHMIPMAWVKDWPGLALGVAAGCLMYVGLERPIMGFLRRLTYHLFLVGQRQQA